MAATDRATASPWIGSKWPTSRPARAGRWRTTDAGRRSTSTPRTGTRSRAARGGRCRSPRDCWWNDRHRETPTIRPRPDRSGIGRWSPEPWTSARGRPDGHRIRCRRCRTSAASPRADRPRRARVDRRRRGQPAGHVTRSGSPVPRSSGAPSLPVRRAPPMNWCSSTEPPRSTESRRRQWTSERRRTRSEARNRRGRRRGWRTRRSSTSTFGIAPSARRSDRLARPPTT